VYCCSNGVSLVVEEEEDDEEEEEDEEEDCTSKARESILENLEDLDVFGSNSKFTLPPSPTSTTSIAIASWREPSSSEDRRE